MNYVVLQPGEAVYVPADGVHDWLSGDTVECMARSDNLINTGFCPRADKDNIDLFTSALKFDSYSAEQSKLGMSIHPVVDQEQLGLSLCLRLSLTCL